MSAKRWNESRARVDAFCSNSGHGERADHASALSRGPRSNGSRLLTLAACGLLLTLNGCSWWRSITGESADSARPEAATTRPTTTQRSDINVAPVPPALAPRATIVSHGRVPGPVPLVYLVEADGAIRVRNTETGEEIVTFDAKAAQIVRVDPGGVFLANRPVIGATLAPGNYAIEIVPPGTGIQSTQQRTILQSQ